MSCSFWICLSIAIALTSPQPSIGQTSAPTLDVVPIASRDKVERNEPVDIYLSITNKSKLPLNVYQLSIAGQAFAKENLPNLPILIAPYGSSQATVVLKPQNDTKFGLHRVMLVIDFTWSEEGKEFASAQAAAITVEVTRKFEEEAKGFPGGTAAFLYLLLPIIPAILSYQMVEQLRTTGSLQAPKFEAAHIVPAFFVAIVLSFFMLWLARGGIDYSNPRIFAAVLVGSLVLGALIPGGHWAWNGIQNRLWAFSPKDSMPRYLEKALLGPKKTDQFKWVTAKSNNETWKGLLLEQPNGTKVLGACLQASRKLGGASGTGNQSVQNVEAVLDRAGNIKDADRLVALAKSGDITLQYLTKIKRGDNPVDATVAVVEITSIEEGSVEITPLVMLVG